MNKSAKAVLSASHRTEHVRNYMIHFCDPRSTVIRPVFLSELKTHSENFKSELPRI